MSKPNRLLGCAMRKGALAGMLVLLGTASAHGQGVPDAAGPPLSGLPVQIIPGAPGLGGMPNYPRTFGAVEASASAVVPAQATTKAPLAGTTTGTVEEYPVDLPPATVSGAPVEGAPTISTFVRPHQERWWVGGGYTAAFIRPTPFGLPLVTTGAATDNPPGALGQPGTAVAFGGRDLDYGTAHGGYLDLGLWLDADNCYSVDLTGFVVAPSHVGYLASSDFTGSPAILRPVFGTATMREVAFVDALPGVAAGGTQIDTRALLLGGEFNVRCHAYWWRRLHADALLGFRTLHFEEGLNVQDRLEPLTADNFTFNGAFVNPGSTITDINQFKTYNTFYGAQLGGRLRWEYDWMYVDIFGKIAAGVNSQIANISGSSTLVSPGGTTTVPGGILALSSNSGNHRRDQVGYVREVGFNLGFDLLQHVRLKLGYSFLSWSGVVRPGDTVDRVVNPHLVPTDQTFGTPGGPARPTFVFKDELLYVHFLNVGLELHY